MSRHASASLSVTVLRPLSLAAKVSVTGTLPAITVQLERQLLASSAPVLRLTPAQRIAGLVRDPRRTVKSIVSSRLGSAKSSWPDNLCRAREETAE